MMRLWQRALRRTQLPLRLSEGFHIRPRVSFAMARGVGIASLSEWFEFELADWVNPDIAYRQLAPQIPPGIAIREMSVVAPSDRAVVRRIVYHVRLDESPEDLRLRIGRLLARSEIVVQRGSEGRQRRIDIRPLLADLAPADDGLRLVAECRQSGSLRPEEILAELDFSPDQIAHSLITRIDAELESDGT
jgi:radical SAM-linked protein